MNELPDAVQASWHRFLDVYEPLRPDLYRYCRYLTRSPWVHCWRSCHHRNVPYHVNGYRYWM